MPHRISSVLLAAGAASAVAAGVASIGTAGAHPAAPAAAKSCNVSFTATPRVGPDRGHAQSGTLTVNRGAGSALSGTLALKSGVTAKWRGQLNGQAISLIIAIPKQGVLFGTGMLAEPLANGHCGLTAGGTFAGPRGGDIGDWTGLYVTAEGCPPGAFRISSGNEGISRSGYYGCLPLYYYGNGQ